MNILHRLLLAAVCAATAFGAAAQSAADKQYPNRPIKLVVPFPPGGPVDTQARLIGDELRKRWGATVVVENKPGGATIIGTDAVAKSPADGYTLILTSPAGVVQYPWMQKLPYDPIKDLQPVSLVAYVPLVLAVPATSDIKTYADFVAYAKTHRNKMSYASVGVGSTAHIYGELLNNKLGAQAVHSPYKGDAPAMLDMLSGRVDYIFSTLVSAVTFAERGNIRLLAITGNKRLPTLPNVPTLKELGVSDFDLVGWYAVFAPAGVPPAITEKLHDTLDEVYRTKAFATFLATAGVSTESLTVRQFTDQIKHEHASWGRLIQMNNIKLD